MQKMQNKIFSFETLVGKHCLRSTKKIMHFALKSVLYIVHMTKNNTYL